MVNHTETIKNAVIAGKRDEIKPLVLRAIGDRITADVIIKDALIAAMDVVGREFGAGNIFIPEMLASAVTMKAGLDVIKPMMLGGQGHFQGTVIMATVKGDLHDIGKNLVSMMIEGAGFKVVDLGVDLSPGKLVEEVRRIQPDVLGLSALLTTTMPELKKVIDELKAQGLREKVKVMVGGAPVDRAFSESIGADGYGADAAEAVALVRRMIGAGAG